MTTTAINETGCVVTTSHVTGDILCRWPGADCDCLMQRTDPSYKPENDGGGNDDDQHDRP
jgi:hypothetical protein